jgi:hypothetical protein
MTWKFIGVLALLGVCALYGLPLVTIGKVTVVYHVITFLLYIAHERAWGKYFKRPPR